MMKNERVIKLSISLLLYMCTVMFTDCASIVSKSQYLVTISSNPSGATYTIKNKRGADIQKGTTPATVILSAKAGFFNPASYSFQFEKKGYLPAATSLSAGMDGWYVGNILFGGLIGILIVDPATGAMWKLHDTVYGNLSPDPNFKAVPSAEKIPLQSDQGGTESIVEKLKQLKKLKELGILTEKEYEKKRRALVKKL